MTTSTTWLELVGPRSSPDWVLRTRDRHGRTRETARMPAPPAVERSPQHLIEHDRIDAWISRHVNATSVFLRRFDGAQTPTWQVETHR